MKKVIFLFIFCLSSMFGAKAQFQWGVQAGLNISELTLMYRNYSKVGPTVGVTGRYEFKNNLRINSGLMFSVKGSNGVENTLTDKHPEDAYFNFRMHYLELPLTVSYKLTIIEHINVVPEAGFYGAYGIGGHAEKCESFGTYNDWNPFKGSYWADGTREVAAFNRWDGGLRFGLSAEVYQFDLGIHYDLGLSRIQDDFPNFDSKRSTLRNASLTLGYTF